MKQKSRTKSKKLDLNNKKTWKDIVQTVDKKEVPIDLLDQIAVMLVDGTSVYIDIKKLIENGQNPYDIEDMLDQKFEDLNDYIESVDFFIDVDKVADTVQPETNRLLKNL